MKKPISFFFVEYDHLDHWGYLLAFLSFTPPFLVAIQTSVYVTLLITSKSTRTRGFRIAADRAGKLLLGQLLNEILNLVLKNVLRQPRPSTLSNYKDFGLPSSHSQFMAFLAAIFPSSADFVVRKILKWPQFFSLTINSACFLGTFLIAHGR